jgi:hypothetical protein
MTYRLCPSSRSDKKFMVVSPSGKKVHFGQQGYSDYTIHKDKARMERYLNRHRNREDWTKTGVDKAGFWARWILWNKPGLMSSIRDTEKRFKIRISKCTK